MRRHLEPLLAGLAGLLLGSGLALGLVWRDLDRLGQAVLGYGQADSYGAVDLHHAFQRALLAGRWTLVDPDQLHPVGFSRVGDAGGNSLEFVLGGLFALILDFPAWYNVAALAWIPLNLLAFLPLGRHLWGRWGPALAAGAAWAMMPPVIGQIAAGRLTQVVLFALPLALLGLLKLSEEGGRRAAVLAGVGMGLAGLSYWFYGYFMALLAPLILLPALWRRPRRELLVEVAQAAGVCLLVIAPLLLLVLSERSRFASGSFAVSDPTSPDALSLWGPGARHMQGWLPWVFLPGFALTLWKGHRRALWSGLVVLTLVFAMGAAQVSPAGWTWRLPYWVLWKLAPGLDRMTHPDRWVHVAGLFLTLLAADGLARWKAWATWVLPLGVFVQLQVMSLPMGSWRPGLEPPYTQLAQQSGGAVVVLPFLQCADAVRFQPFHGRPLVGGMVERMPEKRPPEFEAFVLGSPLLTGLFGLSQGEDVEVELWQEDLEALQRAGVDTLLLDRQCQMRSGTARDVALEEQVTELLGPPQYRHDAGAVWALPTQGGRAGAPPRAERELTLRDIPNARKASPGAPRSPPPQPPSGAQGQPPR